MRLAQYVSAICILLLPAVQSFAATGEHATIKIGSPVFDFGTVSQGITVEHDFTVRNTGKGDLLIEKVIPSCGCTVGKVEPETVAPGETGVIHVAFDTTGFSGRKVKTVRVYTNDPNNDAVLLTVKGVIEPDTRVEPKQIFIIDAIKDGEKISGGAAKLVVEVREGADVKLGPVRTYSKYLKIQELESSETRKVLQVELLPTAPLGEIRDKIIVSISGGKRKSINVPVYAAINGPVVASQSVVSFGVVAGTEPIKRSIKITNRGEAQVAIQEVTSSNPAIATELVEIQPGKAFVLHITLDPTRIQEELSGTIEIKTDDEISKSVPVSIVGIVTPESPETPGG